MPKKETENSLTKKEARFVEEYLVDLNGTQAYLRSHPGVAETTARTEASKLLAKPCVEAALAEAMARRAKRTAITQDKVLKELARIAFSDQRHFSKWGPDGIELVPSSELSTDQARAVAEITEQVSESSSKKGSSSSVSRKVKLHDKVKALDLLGRHFGVFKPQQLDLNGQIEIVITDYRTKKPKEGK